MLQYVKQGKISIEKVVEKMCHAPAKCFQIAEAGIYTRRLLCRSGTGDMNGNTNSEQRIIFCTNAAGRRLKDMIFLRQYVILL